MNTGNNTPNVGFLKAYNMLPAGEQAGAREEMMDTCDWTAATTFYAKLNGSTPIKKLEWAALESIFSKWNIDVRTGEYLKQAV